MRTLTLISIALILICLPASAQRNGDKNNISEYDSVLAKKLGADVYGMKTYVMAFLKSGPVKITDKAERENIQRAHLKNIMRLASEGKLLVAGPFLDNKELRGIFIFNVSTVEEAEKLAETDPAVKAGVLALELHPWYGSAAIMEIPELSRKLEKLKIVE